MEEINAKIKLSVEGSEDVKSAFTKIGGSINATSLNISTLINSFEKLYGYAKSVGKFFLDAALDSAESSRQYEIMKGRVEAVGLSFETASPVIDAFTKKMMNLGVADEDVNKALGRFILQTGNVEDAIKYTTLASDLAINNFGDMASNVDLLEKIMMGKGVRALMQYGIELDDNATRLEQLAAVQSKVIMTTEEFANTAAGNIARMNVAWGELKERVGDAIGPTLIEMMDNVSGRLLKMNDNAETLGVTLGEKILLNARLVGVALWDIVRLKFGSIKEDLEAITLDFVNEQEKKKMDAQTKSATLSKKLAEQTSFVNRDKAEDYAKQVELERKAAEEEASIFSRLAKSVISDFEKQQDAIKEYKQELEDLDKTYKEKLGDMARNSEKSIKDLDEQIAEERSTMSKGWRTRIEKLEAQKAEAQAIISRIGGTGAVNVSEELAKDELSILQNEYLSGKSDIQTKIANIQSSMENNAMKILSSDFWDKYISENQTLAGEIGIGELSQSFTFNFNGDVNDKEALMQSIINTLNREATLRSVGK